MAATDPVLLGDGVAGGGLRKETNWWGAFVIGLAGTILVTGIAPVMVSSFGAAAVPQMVAITILGVLLCFILAELSAMMPDRTGGLPTYAYAAFKDERPRFAAHVNGISCWAYWLGWMPVGPLNMIIASLYLSERFGLGPIDTFTPINTPIAVTTVIIAIVGLVGLFIPAYMGIRLGAGFATVLGLLSMIPLTFLAIAAVFRPSVANWGELSGFKQLDGSSFFSDYAGHGWFVAYLGFAFLLTWNVLAMEAAACYIGECRDPARDAKIAMTAEGLYGLFVYTMIPVSFVVVLGAGTIGGLEGAADPSTMFVTFAGELFQTGGEFLNWCIAIMLIVALALSALNAIMGSARGLHQMTIDGQFPRIFSRVNQHGVPSFAMGFSVVVMIGVVFLGGAVEIYSFSNVGYTFAMLPVLVAYFLLRQRKPHLHRPYRLPEFMKWVALAMAIILFIIWLVGGLVYSSFPNAEGNDYLIYYLLGWGVMAAYVVLYLYRTRVEDPRHPDPPTPLSDTEQTYVHDK